MSESPSDRNFLAPVDNREHGGWTRLIRSINNQGRPAVLSDARGYNRDATSRPIFLLVTRVLPTDNDVAGFRAARAMQVEPRKRGHQARIPTPQELIKQVTGIGDPTRGR